MYFHQRNCSNIQIQHVIVGVFSPNVNVSLIITIEFHRQVYCYYYFPNNHVLYLKKNVQVLSERKRLPNRL